MEDKGPRPLCIVAKKLTWKTGRVRLRRGSLKVWASTIFYLLIRTVEPNPTHISCASDPGRIILLKRLGFMGQFMFPTVSANGLREESLVSVPRYMWPIS